MGEVRQCLEGFMTYANPKAYNDERAKHCARMYDLGEFMKALKKGFTREEVQRRCENDEPLRKRELMRCRVRYFSDGVVLGSIQFVDDFFESQRDRFSKKRKTGSRAMAGGDWQDLCTVRDLRVDAISASEAFC